MSQLARYLLGRSARTTPLPGVLSETQLDQAISRERALSDRSLIPFSLLVVQLAEADDRARGELADILRRRMRQGDLLGRLDRTHLAVILPLTDAAGARCFAADVRALAAAAGLSCNGDIFTYPDPAAAAPVHRERELSPPPTVAAANGQGSSDRDHRTPPPSHGTNGNGSFGHGGNGNNGTGAKKGESRERGVAAGEPARLSIMDAPSMETHDPFAASLQRDIGPAKVAPLWKAFVQPLSKHRRAFDIAVSAALLVLLSPLFLLIALLIKLTSRGPVLFRQQRAGLGGRPFTFYKFRSMQVGADLRKAELSDANEQDGPVFKMRNDPRMTPVGRFLRRASLDELPQLWNVLRGDMSLIGPRPPTLDEVENYEHWQRGRLGLTGGLTCLWQVNGRSEIGFTEWVRLDLRYARAHSPLGDLAILLKTVGAVLTGRGAY